MEISRKGIGGPKTAEGKMRVSLNALKHGLRAESEQAMDVLNEQVGRDYEEVHEELRAHFKPRDPLEELLVCRIARASWRTQLTQAIENKELERRGHVLRIGSHYEKIIRNERLIDMQLHRAVYALERKRQREYENATNKLNPPRSTRESTSD